MIFCFFFIIINGVGPGPAIRVGLKRDQPDLVGLGRLAAQQSLSLSLLMGLGLTWSSHLGWAEMVPAHFISELFCRNVNNMQLRSCRLQRKVRGRRRRRELHDIEASTVRRRFDWWLWKRWWRGWSLVLLLFYVGGVVVTMAGAGATLVAEKRVAALATVEKDESC